MQRTAGKKAGLLSGVPAKPIKHLAIAYGKTKPACIYSAWTAGGAQRTGNGMYYTWLMLALAAMTGNATVRGGGIGSLSPNEGMSVKLGKAPGMAHGKTFKPLLFSTHVSSQVIMTGRDTRTPEQLREDIKLLNGIDLGEDPRLHLEMFIKGAGSGDVFNQRAAINPKLEAWNKLTSVITFDRFMSTTGRYSDIIFPVVTHFEAGCLFAQSEGIIPAPESSHAIAAAIREANKCKETGEEKVILFNLSGHGLIDMTSYDKYLAGDLVNYSLTDDDIQKNLDEIGDLAK